MSGCQKCQQLHAIQNRAEWRVKKYKKPDWKKNFSCPNRIVDFFAYPSRKTTCCIKMVISISDADLITIHILRMKPGNLESKIL